MRFAPGRVNTARTKLLQTSKYSYCRIISARNEMKGAPATLLCGFFAFAGKVSVFDLQGAQHLQAFVNPPLVGAVLS